MSAFLENNCCGNGPHRGPNEVRVYPLGGGANLILCQACWANENRYRHLRGVETKRPADFPQLNWNEAQLYAQETE